MDNIPNIISYFKSCYQTDLRAVHLLDFYSRKVSHQLVLESAELLEGKLMQFPVPSVWGAAAAKKLAIYAKEKALYCGAFFLHSKMMMIGKVQRVFAPLIIYPATLFTEEEVYYVSLDFDNRIINPAFTDSMKAFADTEENLYDLLSGRIPTGTVGFDEMDEIEKVLSGAFPKLNIEQLESFPELAGQKEIEKLKRQKPESPAILSAIGIGVMDKPKGSLGILAELEKMAHKAQFSVPVRDLFQADSSQRKYIEIPRVLAPVTLSKAQEEIFAALPRFPLLMVNGPPGTGKTFTIAALAVDLLSLNKSVLIASKNDQAVNVVADKIEKDLGLTGIVVRASKNDYKVKVQQRIKDILSGSGVQRILPVWIEQGMANIKLMDRQLLKLEEKIRKEQLREVENMDLLINEELSFFKRIKKYFYLRHIEKTSPLWGLLFEVEGIIEKRHHEVRKQILMQFDFQLNTTLRKYRGELKKLYLALRSRTSSRKASFFEDIHFKRLLRTLPIWVANTADIHKVLPLEPQLFDVAIIDEATQCDIASSLPILQRAKQAIIVGDPKQLRHLSFLSNRQQQELIKQHELTDFDPEMLNYREKSILDLVLHSFEDQDRIHFLDEHFRSMPDIIDFSNQYFYNGRLKIMTGSPDNLKKQNIILEFTEGELSKKGYNEIEAEALIEKVRSVIELESHLDKKFCQSIGVLSPFRKQIDFIQKRLDQAFGLYHFERHNLLIGTPQSFQGEERDVMFLSFAIDDKTHASTFQYLNREDVFNVSITRARSRQHLFYSFDFEKVKKEYLLAQYLQKAQLGQFREDRSEAPPDHFLHEVDQQLRAWGLEEIYHYYTIAGIEIDLMIVHKKHTYCIDLIGYPGAYELSIPIDRWKMLERTGIKTFALPYSRWLLKKDKVLAALKIFLNISTES